MGLSAGSRQLVEAALDTGCGFGWGWQTSEASCKELKMEHHALLESLFEIQGDFLLECQFG